MDAVNPTAVMTALAVAAVPIYHLLVKKPAVKDSAGPGAGDRPPLRRRSSILEELTSVPLILRVVMWLQCFQGLLAWLAPKAIADLYGVSDISSRRRRLRGSKSRR